MANLKFNLSDKQTTRLPVVDGFLTGMLTGDFDLNGYIDITTLPYQPTRTPRMFFNGLGAGPGIFSRSAAFDEIQPGTLYGAVANDWNTDGDVDLYLGRTVNASTGSAEHFFYQAQNQSDGDVIPNVAFLKVRLVGNAAESNRMAVGAKVEVLSSAQRIGPTQWVSGGDGRGGQKPRTLVFGFPANSQPSGTVDVRVVWPDGFAEIFPGVALNNGKAAMLSDTRVPQVQPGSVIARKNLNASTGDIDWVFEWKSNRPLTDIGVRFNPNPSSYNNQPPCFCGGDGQMIVINGQTGNSTSVQAGPWTYEYTISWPGWCCDVACKYEIEVFGTFDGQELSQGPISSGPKVCAKVFPSN
jgi:hypothetical protein